MSQFSTVDPIIPYLGQKRASNSLPPALRSVSATREEDSRVQTASRSGIRFKDFQERGLISQETVDIIPFEYCTRVQAETLGPILEGCDIACQDWDRKNYRLHAAAIERLLKQRTAPDRHHVSILVLSPTRELAQQIAKESVSIVAGRRSVEVQCVVGGTNMRAEAARFDKNRIDILVATPGRLIDHIQNSNLGPRFKFLQCLVLDGQSLYTKCLGSCSKWIWTSEADRLLDQGFMAAIQTILGSLPDRNTRPRQTLLFSATLPKEVQRLSSAALLPTYRYISTISETEQSTHEHVKQEVAVVNSANILTAAMSLLHDALSASNTSKIIAFLPTARETGLFAELFANIMGYRNTKVPIFEVHSRKSQSARTKATDGFRSVNHGILFSSDVTARGIDIPGVTAVVQIGLPMDSDQYIHRLGRTARAGNEGRGILLLSNEETFFMKKKVMQELPIKPLHNPDVISSPILASWKAYVAKGLNNIDDDIKAQAYVAWMGFRRSFAKDLNWSSEELVRQGNNYALDVLLYRGEGTGKPPPIFSTVVGKMGLKEVRNLLNVVPDDRRKGGPDRRHGKSGRRHGFEVTK
ncbi:hypothetical protein BS47DRAFT_1387102 [Hydnum rufescens UP504]|uniref:ATP-dependent RNA helicase n=1 Tax=Hydnum rufescens UP504 TaxID=1448309 RepID=A0A9P6B9X3_9AGAM|nr:hypothetical protein BS47DRAFT_1387102 [Hydnum rufescens UP504]